MSTRIYARLPSVPTEEKDEAIKIRLDADLAAKAKKKALRYGGLSAVIRAFLRAWVERGGMVSEDDIARENERAPKTKE